jgi:hypothetical protein
MWGVIRAVTNCAYQAREMKGHHAKIAFLRVAVASYECLANDEFCAEIVPDLSSHLPDGHPRWSAPSHDRRPPETRLLKKHELSGQKTTSAADLGDKLIRRATPAKKLAREDDSLNKSLSNSCRRASSGRSSLEEIPHCSAVDAER